MTSESPIPPFSYLLQAPKPLKLAYIHVVQSVLNGDADLDPKENVDFAVDTWDSTSPVIIAGNSKAASVSKVVDEEYPDKDVVIVFGRRFISTPDLIFRLKSQTWNKSELV